MLRLYFKNKQTNCIEQNF